ncbi:MAG: SOS response-associated peptidase [Coriobacteriales bacterium]|jgi:putative SOS response-associated peptidase YedK|nr:SOS response-associated peptidase [Coriobacteriales bacterium]
MCGRYVIFAGDEAGALRLIVEEAQRRADEAESGVVVKTGEVFPTDVAPVLVAEAPAEGSSAASSPAASSLHAPGSPAASLPAASAPAASLPAIGSLTARPMVWGYPGFDERRSVIFNTRIEQAAQRPMWSESFALRRCVVPVSGFYEWQRTGGRSGSAASGAAGAGGKGAAGKGASPKQKLLFTLAGEPVLYLAGIYRGFGAPAETDTPSVIQAVSALRNRFSIMTTAANASIRDVHDRMPVILRPGEVEEWLFGEPRAFSTRSGIELQRQGA